ncbi:MAG: competence/damage-inducible protein A [Candidatus Aminicenantes bacterium]|nr:competence/damage-inducible protein A [Candidatus Aminicenantes bacterium]
MRVEIISIGSEMLAPEGVDTNSLYLTRELNRLGLEVQLKTTVGDTKEILVDTFKSALRRSELIIATGGIGPTADDVTKQALCRAIGRQMTLDEEVLDYLKDRFARRGKPFPPHFQQQATIPQGSLVLKNPVGTAPGVWITENQKNVILLPGVPHEMEYVFHNSVLLRLREIVKESQILDRRVFKVVGLNESEVDQLLKEEMAELKGNISLLAGWGEIEIRLKVIGRDKAEAERIFDQYEALLRQKLGSHLLGKGEVTLEGVVGELLREKGATLAVAESCTGGLLGSRITDISGSSDYFNRGIVAYSNVAKIEELDVPQELIESHGAVSPEVAKAMAEGVRRLSQTDYGIGITGIAGPTGGTPDKPVGLVYIGVASEAGTRVEKFILLGSRKKVKFQSAQKALEMLREVLLAKR